LGFRNLKIFKFALILNFENLQRIVVSVSNDLVSDQRVARTCHTLAASGYELMLIGRCNPDSIALERSYKIARLKVPFSKGFFFYAFFNLQLFFKLLFHKKDILVANDLDTLLPNFLVSKLQGKPLVFDSHELFSEVPELTDRPLVKSFWRFLEGSMLPKISHGITVSASIANYYTEKYQTHFTVIRNLPKTESKAATTIAPNLPADNTLLIYQGAVNVGRGLELLMDTLPLVEQTTLIIAGDGDILQDLKNKVKQIGIADRVLFLGKLTPEQLRALTPKAALGFSLEEDLGLNYRFALPNKLFDYIHAGVPVVVSNLPEMKGLVEAYQVGKVLMERTPEGLAALIKEMLNQGKQPYHSSLELAKQELNWKKEQHKLLDLIQGLS